MSLSPSAPSQLSTLSHISRAASAHARLDALTNHSGVNEGIRHPHTHKGLEAAFDNLRVVFDSFAAPASSMSHDSEAGDYSLPLPDFYQIVDWLAEETNTPVSTKQQVNAKLRIACRIPDDTQLPQAITFPTFVTFFAAFDDHHHVLQTSASTHPSSSSKHLFEILQPDEHVTNPRISPSHLLNVLNSYGLPISIDEAKAMTDLAVGQTHAQNFHLTHFHNIVKMLASDSYLCADQLDFPSHSSTEE